MATAITGKGTLTSSGYYTIASTTTITGQIYGASNVTPTITNFGTINLKTGTHGAIDLLGGGTVNNKGFISGGTIADGVEIKGNNNGLVTNAAGKYIRGTTGISFLGSADGTVINAGIVIGDSGSAIYGKTTGTVTNTGTLLEIDPGDTLSGAAVYFVGAATVTNSGLILSTNTENMTGALGIQIGSGTIINSGTIQGAAYGGQTYAVDFSATTGKDLLILKAGQTLGGIALAHGTNNTVVLSSGTGIGTIANPGNYIDFQTLVVSQGADWAFGAAGSTTSFTSFPNFTNNGTVNVLGTVIASPTVNSGTIIVSGSGSAFIDSASLSGGGTVAIASGGHVTLANTLGSDAAQTILFGTGGTSLALNTLDITGSTLGFAGTIAGFGLNDDIILGSSVLPTVALGSQVTLAYAGSLLTVSELNSAGSVIGKTTLNVGTGFSASSFVALLGTNGVNIETAATVDEAPLTFNASGTASFEDPTKYTGGLAPGSSIVSGETVIIASGTASIASTSPVVNSGTIIVSGTGSAFIDPTSLSGGGTVAITNGGQVTLANTLGSDAAQTILFGTGGTSLALNTLDITGSTLGFAGTIAGFGLDDDIILGSSVLPTVALGSQVTLAYAGSLLTVSELNSAGSVIGTMTLNVGTGFSASSFVALLGTNGVNIETAATVDEKPLSFTGTAGTISNFEDPTKYAGGLAPGATIAPGETVIITPGTASISSTSPVTDNGTIIVSGTSSALIDTAPLGGNGTVAIGNGGQVTFANTIGTDTPTVYFGTGGTSNNPNLLDLTGLGTTSFGGTIANFGTFDTIILGPTFLPGTETSFSTLVSGGLETLTVTSSVNGTIHTDALTFSSPPPGIFTVGNSPNGIVIADMPCFAAGTRILTGDGQRAVERLAVGDRVLSARDGAEAEVIWVGSRTIDLARHAMPEKVRPVRILAGAFGEGLPERDLRLSPDHALYIDGHLIEAKTLVNGVTVIEERETRFVTYHHIELANHDIILAEGLAAESYLESGNRMMFESDAAPVMLHPDFAAVSRAKACAPLATDGEVVVAARRRILERAVALGFVTTAAVDLTVKVAGEIMVAEMAGNELLFTLPGGAAHVELVSSTGVPAQTGAEPGDRRVLGVAVTGLALIAGGKRIVISLDDPAHSGFYEMEDGHRWTNGAARIALPAHTGRAVLEVTINGQAQRWVNAA